MIPIARSGNGRIAVTRENVEELEQMDCSNPRRRVLHHLEEEREVVQVADKLLTDGQKTEPSTACCGDMPIAATEPRRQRRRMALQFFENLGQNPGVIALRVARRV